LGFNKSRWRWSYWYRRGYNQTWLGPTQEDIDQYVFALRDYQEGWRDREDDIAAEREAQTQAPVAPPVSRSAPRKPRPREELIDRGDFAILAVLLPVIAALAAAGVAWYLDAHILFVGLIAAAAALGLVVLLGLSGGTPELHEMMAGTVAIAVAVWLLLAWRGVVDWLPPHPW
jgi:predicted anti-sigma-YlaC factor YlaD